jgi:hypothetical protein
LFVGKLILLSSRLLVVSLNPLPSCRKGHYTPKWKTLIAYHGHTQGNRLHWVLDVTFREDNCRVRKDHAPQNLSTLRKFALSLLRQDARYPKRLRSRRKTAERHPDYRASLLGLGLGS